MWKYYQNHGVNLCKKNSTAVFDKNSYPFIPNYYVIFILVIEKFNVAFLCNTLTQGIHS